MKDVSFLIPCRNEKYLEQTIKNVLSNIRGNSEVLVYLDGYLPDPPLQFNDDRVIFHHPQPDKAVGHRAATNYLARQAQGKYIMKLDAHCAIDEGFDLKMMADCEYDWTVIPRMYNLDVDTWKPKLFSDWKHAVRMGKVHDYIMMGQDKGDRLRTLYYPHEFNKKLHHERKDILIDETMSCMGPGFFMHKDRFFELGGCDEATGTWGQQGIEVACKAWLSGGKLMVNKKTWFAHWFRGGGGPGWPYPISAHTINEAKRYSEDMWLNDKWPLAKHKFQWLIEKFNPPGWNLEGTPKKELQAPEIHRLIRNMFNLRAQGHPSPIAARKGDRNTIVELWAKAGYKEGVEIGVASGEFSERILKTGIKLNCVDPWDTYKDSRLTVERQAKNYACTLGRLDSYIKSGKCVIHKEYSEDASKKFEDGSLDFVFIDGMHTFDGCALDLIKWVPKVRKGGMIALHDYCPMNRNGVIKAVDAYTYCHQVHPWYVTREIINTAFWVVE